MVPNVEFVDITSSLQIFKQQTLAQPVPEKLGKVVERIRHIRILILELSEETRAVFYELGLATNRHFNSLKWHHESLRKITSFGLHTALSFDCHYAVCFKFSRPVNLLRCILKCKTFESCI